jgi:hypothetical protein
MKTISVFSITVCLFCCCKSPAGDKKKEALYPFPQYIQSQIAYLDSAQLGIEMIVQENGVTTDSGYISREVFKKLAHEFLSPDPNEKDIRDEYSETSFNDLSLNTITFSITTKNLNLPLQQADILLSPDNKQVRYLILKKQIKTAEGIASSSLMWRHNLNFQIVTSITAPDGHERSKLIRVIWDKPTEELLHY